MFLSFEVERDEFFITVFKNVLVCMVKYYLMEVFLRITRTYGIVCQCDKLTFSLSNPGDEQCHSVSVNIEFLIIAQYF